MHAFDYFSTSQAWIQCNAELCFKAYALSSSGRWNRFHLYILSALHVPTVVPAIEIGNYVCSLEDLIYAVPVVLKGNFNFSRVQGKL
jgi:hypothetical protein